MEKWQSFTVQETEEKLNTSASVGLSRTEAKARIDEEIREGKKNRRPLYLPRKKGILKCLLTPMTGVYFIIYLVISLFALVGGDLYFGLWTSAIMLVQVIALGVINYLSVREKEKASLYSSPSVRVMRSGAEKLTDMSNIAVGDVIHFSAGDVVPFDVRLTDSEELCVDEFVFDDKKNKLLRRRKEKTHDRVYDINTKTSYADAENMLVAGSVILEGSGKGIVVAAATDVLLAERFKKGELSGDPPRPAGVSKLIDTVKRIGVISAIALLIMTVAGMISLRKTDILEAFLLFLSPLIYTSSVSMDIWCRYFFASALKAASENTIVKNNKAFDTLANLSDIVILGNAGITDGEYHVSQLFLSGRGLDINMIETKPDRSHRLCECIYTYLKVTSNKDYERVNAYRHCLEAFMAQMGFDKDGADLKIKSLYYLENEESDAGFACAQTQGANLRITMAYEPYILTKCKNIRVGDMVTPLDNTLKKRILDFVDSCESNGEKLIFWISEEIDDSQRSEGGVLEGIMALEEHTVSELDVTLEKYREMGVSVTCLIKGEDSESIKYAVISGMISSPADTRIAYASDFRANGHSIDYGIGNYRVYAGFEMSEYAALVSHMRSEGRVVVTYGVDDAFNGVMNVSDCSVSCCDIKYHSKEYLESFYSNIHDSGLETSKNSSQRGRITSGVLVKRSGENSGLCSILSVADASCSSYINLSYYLKYFAFVVSGLFTLALLSALSGLVLINVPQMLIIYLFCATVGLYMYSQSSPQSDFLRRSKRGYFALPEALLKRSVFHFATRAIAVFIYFVIALILTLTGVTSRDGITFSSFLCMLGLSMFEMFRISREYAQKSRKRGMISLVTVVFAWFILMITLVIFGVFAFEYFTYGEYDHITAPIINALSYLYGGEVHPLSLILVPIFALVIFISELIFNRFSYNVKKKIKLPK